MLTFSFYFYFMIYIMLPKKNISRIKVVINFKRIFLITDIKAVIT